MPGCAVPEIDRLPPMRGHNGDVAGHLEQVAADCARFLDGEDAWAVTRALERAGIRQFDVERAVEGVREGTATHTEVIQLRERCREHMNGDVGCSIERVFLAQYGATHLHRVVDLPVSTAAKHATLRFASKVVLGGLRPDDSRLRAGHPHFGATSRAFQLTRFLSGEFDWDVSGVPRAWLARVEPLALPRMLFCIGGVLRGRRPLFYFHLGIDREPGPLDRAATERSFKAMADSMLAQPAIKGCLAAPWWCSRDTVRVSPRIAWFRDLFLRNGAYIADMGPVDPNCGALARSKTRKRLYDEGDYKPRRALTIWPRAAMLRWASRL